MNILGIELQYCGTFYILPAFSIMLGKSVYFRISWLNFELIIKHISGDYQSKCLSFYFPSMTLNQYPNSAYQYSFEICAFGYFYRKGLFKHKDKEPYPYDNTKGFVHSSWLNQFRKESDYDFIGNLERLLEGMKEMTKKEEE